MAGGRGGGGWSPKSENPPRPSTPWWPAPAGTVNPPPRGTFRNREADELVWVGAGPPAGRRAPGGDRSDRAHQVDQTLESDHPDRAAPGSPRKPALQFRCGAGAPYAAAWSSRSRARWTWWAPCRVHWPPVRVRCPDKAPARGAGVQRLGGTDKCHPAAAERVDQRGEIGDRAGAAVQLGNTTRSPSLRAAPVTG